MLEFLWGENLRYITHIPISFNILLPVGCTFPDPGNQQDHRSNKKWNNLNINKLIDKSFMCEVSKTFRGMDDFYMVRFIFG